jgi:hypothetical protein
MAVHSVKVKMSLIVKRFVGDTSYVVNAGSGGSALTGALVVHPGQYIFQGQSFDCSIDGFYRFWDPINAVTKNIVVYGNLDIVTLMSSMALCCSVGRVDDSLSIGVALTKSTTSSLCTLCGPTVVFIKALCDSLGNIGYSPLTTRIARAVTGGTPGGYFDGHVMLEANIGGAWQLFDLACGTDFRSAAIKDALPLQSPVTRWIRKGVDQNPWQSGQFDTVAWTQNTLYDDVSFQSEMMRVLEIPGIDYSDGNTYFYLSSAYSGRGSYVTGLSSAFRVVSQAAWLAMFYP